MQNLMKKFACELNGRSLPCNEVGSAIFKAAFAEMQPVLKHRYTLAKYVD